MDNRFNMDIYHYGSMRDFKHREALKYADWGNEPLLEKVVSSMVFLCFWAIVLTLLLIVF